MRNGKSDSPAKESSLCPSELEAVEDIDEVIQNILSPNSIRDCGIHLNLFVSIMRSKNYEGQSEILEKFFQKIQGESAINHRYDMPDNNGWVICPPEKNIATLLDLKLWFENLNDVSISAIERTATDFCKDYKPSEKPCVAEPEQFIDVMKYLDKKYDMSRRLFGAQKAVVFFLKEEYIGGPFDSMSLHRNRDDGRYTFHFEFFGPDSLSIYFLGASKYFYVVDSIAQAIVTAAFCDYYNGKAEIKRGILYSEKYREKLGKIGHEYEKYHTSRELSLILRQVIRDAILAESPFVEEEKRPLFEGPNVTPKLKILSEALEQLP